MLIQAAFALLFLVVALALHDELVNHVFEHESALYDVLVVGTLAYAASYFARGWLAGHERFALFGGLVLMESVSRISFALAVAIGIASGADGGRARHRRRAVRLAGRRSGRVRAHRPSVRRGACASRGALDAAITVDEADAALAGPGTEGVQETAAHERPLAAPRRRLRGLGVGHHARPSRRC